jgi:hypothetical protein
LAATPTMSIVKRQYLNNASCRHEPDTYTGHVHIRVAANDQLASHGSQPVLASMKNNERDKVGGKDCQRIRRGTIFICIGHRPEDQLQIVYTTKWLGYPN